MLRPMMISLLPVDSSTKSPIVIIKEVDWERRLPIWIGILEASAIASELEGIKMSRQIDLKAEPEDKTEQGKKWREILKKMNPEDFGNT